MDYEPLDVVFRLHVPQMILGIVIPTLMYILSTYVTVRKLLQNDIAVLLAGRAKGRGKIRKALVGKPASLRKKLCIRSVLGNPGRTCVLFFGVFLGHFVVLWALGCLDTVNSMSTVLAENMGEYQYQYVLNELNTENPYGGETMLAAALEDENGKTVSLFGADDNELLSLKDEEGTPMQVDDRYFITSLYAEIHQVTAGDSITVRNPLSAEAFRIEIAGVVKNDYAKAIYTSREHVSDMSGIDAAEYNVILSKDKLDIPKEKIVTTVDRNTIDEQYQAAISQMNVIIYLLAGIGVVLCIIAVYIAVNMAVTENRRTISMLRVLGYDKKGIRRLLLRDNIFIVIPAILISIPCVIAAGSALFRSFADILGYIIEVYIAPQTYLFSILLTLAGYALSVSFVSRKIAKIDMVESLKDNRE